MILVAGATGQLGSKIARALLMKGNRVRILARGGSDVAALQAAGAEVALGDLKDRGSLDRACAGIATVVTTANTAKRGGDDTIAAVDDAGTKALVDAARGAAVTHFVYTSVLGATPASPVPFLAAKARSEEYLRASGMAWTVLAPNAFMESWPVRVVGMPALNGQPITLLGEGRRRHTFVSEDDVAAFAVTAVDHPAAANQHLPIGGPQALSWRDVVAVYERVLGRTLEVRFVPPGTPVPGIPAPVLPILASLDGYDTDFDAAPVAARFGITLTPLEQVARAQVAGARPA